MKYLTSEQTFTYNRSVSIFDDRIFAIVDTETTGGSPLYDRIIDIAIIRIENGVETDRFSTLLNPDRSFGRTIEAITGIRNVDVENAPRFGDVSGRIHELLSGAIFVAHNARFDYGFLKSELKRADMEWKAKCLCSVKLSRKLFPHAGRHNLDSLIERHGISCPIRHRAMPDAVVVEKFLRMMDKEQEYEQLDAHINDILSKHTLPQHVNTESIAVLPESPGVYFMHGEGGEVIYVGKSKNIRTRVMSHFSGDYKTGKEMRMCQETLEVQSRETAGELGALLLESHLIKSLEPVYNRASRRTKKMLIARKVETEQGFASIKAEYIDTIAPAEFESVMGIFKSQKSLEAFLRGISKEYALCEKLLGLESGKGACFKYHLGQCGGACVGADDVAAYNKRLEAVFKKRRLKSWPFSGPIIIEEKGESYSDAFIVDNWSLIKALRQGSEGYEEFLPGHHNFEYDTYKIVARYILSSEHRQTIKSLTRSDMRVLVAQTHLENVEE